MSQSALPTRRFATIQRTADLAGVSYGTVRNRIKDASLEAFKLPGRKGWFVDLDQAAKVLGHRQQYASFGPDARLHDLSNVVADFSVVE